MRNESVIIIGGGLGGLMTGALLSKEGFKVTVLEKNHTIGGGLQTFNRRGVEFETGMHILGGFHEGGSLNRICRYLGILDKLELLDVDKDCMDEITYMSDSKTYRIASGFQGFIDSLSRYFPAEKEHIRQYTERLRDLTQELDIFYLRPASETIYQHSEDFLLPANEFIAKYIKDEKLQDLLAYMNPMYGGVAGHTPAYVHALINVLYIEGPTRFANGSMSMANALKGVIEQNGGAVMADAEVVRIAVEDREIKYVLTSKGETYTADRYISAVHVSEMLKVIDKEAFPKSYRSRIDSIPVCYSLFTVFLILKENTFPYINHTCYYQENYGSVWNFGEYEAETWPYGFMYMTPPVNRQGDYARALVINSIMPYSVVERWKDTKVGQRGAEYEQWKQLHVDKVLDKLGKIYPDIRQNIEYIYSSSPLTVRDFYNNKEGSIYGYSKDCKNFIACQIPIYTKVRNLLLTGQCVGLHGICGVPLTAINTVEAIIGINKLIEKL